MRGKYTPNGNIEAVLVREEDSRGVLGCIASNGQDNDGEKGTGDASGFSGAFDRIDKDLQSGI
jgi:hypothetical protein